MGCGMAVASNPLVTKCAPCILNDEHHDDASVASSNSAKQPSLPVAPQPDVVCDPILPRNGEPVSDHKQVVPMVQPADEEEYVNPDDAVLAFFNQPDQVFRMTEREIQYMRNTYTSTYAYTALTANTRQHPRAVNIEYGSSTYGLGCHHCVGNDDPHPFCPVCDVVNGNLTCFSTPNDCDYCDEFTKAHAGSRGSHITKRRKERITEKRSGTRWVDRCKVLPGPVANQSQADEYYELVTYNAEFKGWNLTYGPDRNYLTPRLSVTQLVINYLGNRAALVNANAQPLLDNYNWIACVDYPIIVGYRADLLNYASVILNCVNEDLGFMATEHELDTLRGLLAIQWSNRDVCVVELSAASPAGPAPTVKEVLRLIQHKHKQAVAESLNAALRVKVSTDSGVFTSGITDDQEVSPQAEDNAATTRQRTREGAGNTPRKVTPSDFHLASKVFSDGFDKNLYIDLRSLMLPMLPIDDMPKDDRAAIPLTVEAHNRLEDCTRAMNLQLASQPLKAKNGAWATIALRHPDGIPNHMFGGRADVFPVQAEAVEQLDAERLSASPSKLGTVVSTTQEAELLGGLGRLSFKQCSDLWILIGLLHNELATPVVGAKPTKAERAIRSAMQVCGQQMDALAQTVAFNSVIRRRGQLEPKNIRTSDQSNAATAYLSQAIMLPRDFAEERRQDSMTEHFKNCFVYATPETDSDDELVSNSEPERTVKQHRGPFYTSPKRPKVPSLYANPYQQKPN